jgi:hypothetical protein
MDSHIILATVAAEKACQAKTNQVPLNMHLHYFIEFFIQNVRPYLLPQPTTTATITTTSSSGGRSRTLLPQQWQPVTKVLSLACLSHIKVIII